MKYPLPSTALRLLVAGLLSLALVATACSSDDDDQQSVITEPTAVVATATPVPDPDPTPDPEPGPEAPAVEPTIAVETLTDFYGCDFGFWAANPEQTVSLEVWFNDFDAANAGAVPPVGNIPTKIWDGSVKTGTNLMANHCDDLPFEPYAEVSTEWKFIAGDITIVGDVPVAEVGSVTMELVNAVIESPTGETLELGPITITNSSWGALAG